MTKILSVTFRVILLWGCFWGASFYIVTAQSPNEAFLFQNVRIIVGDGRVIENGSLEIRNGAITQVSDGNLMLENGAEAIDASGKTLIPALIDGHSHLGYQARYGWGSQYYNSENLIDNLEQYAYYGFSAVFSAGSDAPRIVNDVEVARENGEFVGAQLLYAAGMAPPGQGPNDLFLGHALAVEESSGETILYGLRDIDQAKEQVRIAAAEGIRFIKLWVDDRGGSQEKLSPDLYRAVIEEANLNNLKVFVHQQFASDMLGLIAAGMHGFLHGRIGIDLGKEVAAAAAASNVFVIPNWGLAELRQEAIGDDEFLNVIYAEEAMASLRVGNVSRQTEITRNLMVESELKTSFQALMDAGVDIVLGTDAGAVPNHPFGYTGHRELEIYVRLGMTPMQAIIAGTSNAARHLGLVNRGSLEVGKSADLILLSENPLSDIRNTRSIERVILNGIEVDRTNLRQKWKP